jgi:hypothetical protein
MLVMRSLGRRLHDLIFVESVDPWSAEVIGYVNGGLAILAALALFFGASVAAGWSLAGGAGTFLLLRSLMASRYTVWLAALLGVGFAGAVCAGLGWIGGQVAEIGNAPLWGAIAGGLLGAAGPAYAYGRYVKRCLLAPAPEERASTMPVPSEP